MRLPTLKLLLISLSILICLGYPGRASAQDVSIVVSPPQHIIEAKPGATIQKTIKVTNNSPDEELILQAFVVDYIVEDNMGTPIKVETTAAGRYLASPWFTLDKSELVIPPKGQEQIIVIVAPPEGALPGGHYAGVFFEPVARKGVERTVSYTSAQVGSLFSITIAGNIKYDAIISEFRTMKPWYEYGPIDFRAVIENQSDTQIKPRSTIMIKDIFGRALTTIPLEEVNIFPYTSRESRAQWDQVWGFGRYTATLSATYGPGDTIERTILFWLIPWRLLAACAVIVLVVIVLGISVRRYLYHQRDTRDNEIDNLKRKIVELENNHR